MEIITSKEDTQITKNEQKEFEKWKEDFVEKNGFYIPCIHDNIFFEELERKKSMKSD